MQLPGSVTSLQRAGSRCCPGNAGWRPHRLARAGGRPIITALPLPGATPPRPAGLRGAGRAHIPPCSTLDRSADAPSATTVEELGFQEGQPAAGDLPGAEAPSETPARQHENPLLDEHTLRAFLAACASLMVVGLDAVDGPGHPSLVFACLTAFVALLPDSSKAFLWERPVSAPALLLAGAIAAAVASVQRGTDPATKAVHSLGSALASLRARLPALQTTGGAEAVQKARAEEPAPVAAAEAEAEEAAEPRSAPAIPVTAAPIRSAPALPTAVTSAMASSLGRGRGKIMVSGGPGGRRTRGSLRAVLSTVAGGCVALGAAAFGMAVSYTRQGMSILEAHPAGMCAAAFLLMMLAALLLAKRPRKGGPGWAA